MADNENGSSEMAEIDVLMTAEQIERMDKYCKEAGITRDEFFERALDALMASYGEGNGHSLRNRSAIEESWSTGNSEPPLVDE